ncbi:RES domain-containing protein, partial [Neisseria gonorrhoeae]|uniref:RES domain-containing protein n=1 Tax=Neisseria gonorrhoeae TaxID=485 RepID=UPI00311F6E26
EEISEIQGVGTMYCSNDIEAALRERLGEALAGRRFIAASELHDTAISIIYPRESCFGLCMADTINATGILTREISTMSDYEITRAWATAFYDAEFDGLAYEPRSTPGRDRIAFAVFGPAGASENLRWAPHPTWWQEMVDKGIIIARISGARAKIID